MSREQVETAIKEGIPFLIRMADGEKYEVTDELKIALGLRSIIILDENDSPHILPLITMTGLSYLSHESAA